MVVGATLLRSCAVLVASAAFLYLSKSIDIFDVPVYIISRDISIRCGATAFGSSSRSCGRDVCFYIIIALVSARGCEELCFLYSVCKCFLHNFNDYCLCSCSLVLLPLLSPFRSLAVCPLLGARSPTVII